MTIERFGSLDGQDVLQVTLDGPRRDGDAGPDLGRGGARSRRAVRGRPAARGAGAQLHRGLRRPFALFRRHRRALCQPHRRGAVHPGRRDLPISMPTRAATSSMAARMGFGTRLWSIVDHTPSSADPGARVGRRRHGLSRPPRRDLHLCAPRTVDGCGSRSRRPATGRRRSTSPPTAISTSTAARTSRPIDLMIAGDYITPTRPDLIPTGEIRRVANTGYDFTACGRSARSDCRRSASSTTSTTCCAGPPASFAMRRPWRRCRNGLSMELWTTEPGVQFYDGHLIDIPVPGPGWRQVRPARRASAWNRSVFPTAPIKPIFRRLSCEPGQVSRQISELRFAR